MHWSKSDWAVLGLAAAASGIILSPFILPAIGIGTAEAASEIMTALHGSGTGTGLAGALNGVVASTPFLGPVLAQGGMFTALATGVVGLGGMLWSRHLKEGDAHRMIPWGAIVKTAALATSALIALPSILTGLSVGLTFLADAIGGLSFANQTMTFLAATVGSTGAMNAATATTSLGAMLPHLLTCGASLLPLSGVWAASHGGTLEQKTVARA